VRGLHGVHKVCRVRAANHVCNLLGGFLMVLAAACGGADRDVPDPEPGIPLSLAEARAARTANVRYDLTFAIPEAASVPIAGTAAIRFDLKDAGQPVVLDFAPGADHVTSLAVAGRPASYRALNGHVVIAADAFAPGENVVEIAFRAGDAALNRNPDFLYSLFVPARAHLTFPCFDQPDIKARFTLSLTTPASWQAISNGAETARETAGGQLRLKFAETQPISTYLFAFAAGRFQVETAERNGRTFRMFHRETDAAKVARNRDAAFDLHAAALRWLEDYTGIPYPFGKFEFLLVPSFQFSGMEHPGSVYYNAASILLDESATENQVLNRASVIAHETAHMWFGDLVTMRWFNDVWMKEVFANFMAAKIVNPSFPKVNHELRFLVAHYPAAYGVDRSEGTHPIRQELDNLAEAGSLYGAIIYQKAPIVMRQLEYVIGQEQMREGLRAYLKQFQFANATWLDLVRLLDERSDRDVGAWSKAWVEGAGRPTIHTSMQIDGDKNRIAELAFVGAQSTQRMRVLVGSALHQQAFDIEVSGDRTVVDGAQGLPPPNVVLPTGGGLAYGAFTIDVVTRSYLLARIEEFTDPVTRGAAWITLWDQLLERRIPPAEFLEAVLRVLPRETTEQNVQLLTGYTDELFWRFLPAADRSRLAPRVEAVLRAGIARSMSSSMKSTYFGAFRSTVTSPEGIRFLERVWRREEKIPGLTLAEPDEAGMALDLAVRSLPNAAAILEEQRGRFTNPDRQARFEFVMPALSADESTRDKFFESLRDVERRRREPWVTEGLRYLNHPLRADHARTYIRPGLDLLVEIRRTGDIFFPRNWMDALLGGHNSPEAAETVRGFLREFPQYPARLRRIIQQSADLLFRATGENSPRS
jgi:aminopeptidase N